jgi:lipid A 4'-phosphatase
MAKETLEMRKGMLMDFLIPGLLLGSFTLLFRVTTLDIALENLFYRSDKGWFLKDANPWNLLYHYGNIPGLALAGAGVLSFILSFCCRNMAAYRKKGLFLGLVMVLGPGLLVNTTFKQYWGRPRPRQIQELGGKQQYLPVWEKGTPGEGKSFPSGHASVAFYLFVPFFFLRKRTGKWAFFFLFLGIFYGLFMGTARMVQGAHFPSDVVWAGGFVYLTGLVISYFFRFEKTSVQKAGRSHA